MQFALLIYGDEAMGNERYAGLSEEEAAAEMGKWFAYTDELKSSGVHVAGEALHETQTASTVRTPNGERLVTDGPFAETREQLGGYTLIEAANLDEAIEIAAGFFDSEHNSTSTIEVRPVVDYKLPSRGEP